jgi:hypothetical protein
MIAPSPTNPIDLTHSRGTFIGAVAETATKAAYVRFGVPNTSYELHLRSVGKIDAQPGKRLIGVVRASARRIDETQTGGRFVEPVIGRPRRVQGTVVAIKDGAVVVDAGIPIHCTPTDTRQKADQFSVGAFVGFDVMDGASIQQV